MPNALPYVGTFKTFTKLSEAEQEKIFNEMRGELLSRGIMEKK